MKNYIKSITLLFVVVSYVFLAGCGDEKRSVNGDPFALNNPNFVGQFALSSFIWDGRLQITNSNVYKVYLREYARLCNSNSITFNFNTGFNSQCGLFDLSRADVSLQLDRDILPTTGAFFTFSFLKNSPQFPFEKGIEGQFVAINSNTGFELRQGGLFNTPSFNATLRLVFTGKLTDSEIRVSFLYRDPDTTGNRDLEIGQALLRRR